MMESSEVDLEGFLTEESVRVTSACTSRKRKKRKGEVVWEAGGGTVVQMTGFEHVQVSRSLISLFIAGGRVTVRDENYVHYTPADLHSEKGLAQYNLGYSWIFLDILGYSWIILDIFGLSWTFLDILV